MRKVFSIVLTIIAGLFLFSACEGGGESSGGVPSDGGGGGKIKHKVSFLRPSPCQRIFQAIDVNLIVENESNIQTVFLTLNNATVAIFDKPPFSTSIFDLPPDGTYTLSAVAKYIDKVTVSADIEIRIDLNPPYFGNLLILDADADPLEYGNANGALFRYNPDGGSVCLLASSPKWVDPTSIVIRGDGAILVADKSSDMDGDGPGIGAIFIVYPDRFNQVELYKSSGSFRAPVDVSINPYANELFVVDYDADPLSIGGAPGAVFAINPIGLSLRTVFSFPQLVTPVSVNFESNGDMWVVDTDADPYTIGLENNRGSIWKYSAALSDISLVAASEAFITPYDMVPNGAGKFILTDTGNPAANISGGLYLVDPSIADPKNSATLLSKDANIKSPAGIIYDPNLNLYLIADRRMDITSSSTRGGILSYNPVGGAVNFYLQSTYFVEPFDLAISVY